METAQEKIDRLNREIADEKGKQNNCKHQFDEAKSDPEQYFTNEIDWSKPMEGHGSDCWFQTYRKENWRPRWSRTCKLCGKVEYTYKQKVVHVDERPDFT